MNINKEEAKFILETVLNAPVQTNIQSIVKGLSATPIVTNLIEKLKAELNENTILDIKPEDIKPQE